MRKYKIVVLGSRGSGKSCLTVQFVHRIFADLYDPTVEDTFRNKIEVDGQRCEVEILDTLSIDYRWDNEQYIKNADGFILVYSIINKSTFEELRGKWTQIRKVKGEEWIPVVLVGNKCDLEDGKRAVEIKEGLRLADEFHANFYETSAKSTVNVDKVFIDLVKQMINYAEDKFPSNCLPLQC